MEKKINSFFLKWNGIGCDFDGAYGFQCMDIYQEFNKEVTGSAIIPSDAIDVINKYDKNTYDFIPNSPTNSPSTGDVILWNSGIGKYGHIAICYYADSNHFVSFDQNYPIGSLCHFQSHNYTNVAGWLHTKANIPDTPPSAPQEATMDFTGLITELTKTGNEKYGVLNKQQIEAKFTAKDLMIHNQLQIIGDLGKQVEELKDQIYRLESDNNSLHSQLSDCQNENEVLKRTKYIHETFGEYVRRIFRLK